MAFSPDSSVFAEILSARNGIRIWTLGGVSHLQIVGKRKYYCISFSPRGQCILSGTTDGAVDIWDISSGVKVQTVQVALGHETVVAVALSFDEQFLMSLQDGHIQILDLASGICKRTNDSDFAFTPERSQGIRTSWMIFRTPDFSHLMTNVGLLSLDTPSTGVIPDVKFVGYRLTEKHSWVVKDGVKLLWIPPQYRDGISAVAGSLVRLASMSGPLLLMRLSY